MARSMRTTGNYSKTCFSRKHLFGSDLWFLIFFALIKFNCVHSIIAQRIFIARLGVVWWDSEWQRQMATEMNFSVFFAYSGWLTFPCRGLSGPAVDHCSFSITRIPLSSDTIFACLLKYFDTNIQKSTRRSGSGRHTQHLAFWLKENVLDVQEIQLSSATKALLGVEMLETQDKLRSDAATAVWWTFSPIWP